MRKLFYILILSIFPSFAGAWGIMEIAVEHLQNNEGAPYLIEKINAGEPIKIMLFYVGVSGRADQASYEKAYNPAIEESIKNAVGEWQSVILNTIAKLPESRSKEFADIASKWNRKDLITFVGYGRGYADLRVNVYINGENITGCKRGDLACFHPGEYLHNIDIAFDPEESEKTVRGLSFYDGFKHEFGHALGLADQGYPDKRKNHSALYYTANDAVSVMTPALKHQYSEFYAGREDENDYEYIKFKKAFKEKHGFDYPRGGYSGEDIVNAPISPDDVEGVIVLSDLFMPAKQKPARFVNGWKSFVRKDMYYMESRALPENIYAKVYEDKRAKGLLASVVDEESVKKDIQGLSSGDLKDIKLAGSLASSGMGNIASLSGGANEASQQGENPAQERTIARRANFPKINPSGIPYTASASSAHKNIKLKSPVPEQVSNIPARSSAALPAPAGIKVASSNAPRHVIKSAATAPNTVNTNMQANNNRCAVCGRSFNSPADKYAATQSRSIHKHSMCAYKYFIKRYPADEASLKSYDAKYPFSTPAKVTAARGLMSELGLTTADIRKFAAQSANISAEHNRSMQAAKAEREAKAAAEQSQPALYQHVTLQQVSNFAAANKDTLKSVRIKSKTGKALTPKEKRIYNQYKQMYKNYQLTQKYSK